MAKELERRKIDFALIQDPYLLNDALYGFPRTWRTHASRNKEAWIVATDPSTVLSFQPPQTSTACIALQTDNGILVIGSQYVRPKSDLAEGIKEWSTQADQLRQLPLVIGGDYNAASPAWGSPAMNARGRTLSDLLTQHDLTTLNDPLSLPTFEARRAKGWPDLTIGNSTGSHLVREWQVLEDESFSDHNFITFRIDTKPVRAVQKRFKTKHANWTQFKQSIRPTLGKLAQDLARVADTAKLEELTVELQGTIQNTCRQTLKRKRFGKTPKIDWWSPELATKRNLLTALRRRAKRSDEPLKEAILLTIRRERAHYKKMMLTSKLRAWRSLCTKQHATFGHAFQFGHGKVFTPHKILAEWGANFQDQRTAMRKLTEHHFPQGSDASQRLLPPLTRDIDVTGAELEAALYTLNANKAPGPDAIDLRTLRKVHETDRRTLRLWTRACVRLGYFPEVLREGEVVYFQKKGKDPTHPDSYRPICLLPTMGKVLEKIIQRRLVHHLETTKGFSDSQHGFREARSCETAHDKLYTTIRTNRDAGKYTSVLSIDIKGAFDSVNWTQVVERLVQLQSPASLIHTISTYLTRRRVTLNWGAGTESHSITKGCPQGSCLGPILWLVIAEAFLRESDTTPDLTTLAYADDFVIMVSDTNRRKMEQVGATQLSKFQDWLTKYQLSISHAKTTVTHILKNDNRLWKRPPIYKLNNKNVRQTESFTYLGLTFTQNLKWAKHISGLRAKTTAANGQLIKLARKTWGIDSGLLKTWYKAVIEKIVVYGAATWAEGLTKRNRQTLDSLQRPFLLRIARAYATTSNLALTVLTGIPPVSTQIYLERALGRVLRLGKDCKLAATEFRQQDYQKKSPALYAHPAKIAIPLHGDPKRAPDIDALQIYTDGSKTPNGVGYAFCAYREGVLEHSQKATLRPGNSVYQAEVLAIKSAMDWYRQQPPTRVNILSDSYSAIQALGSHKQRNPLVQTLKAQIVKAHDEGCRISIHWVPAHTGIEGNEAADAEAKKATESETDTIVPLPESLLKKRAKTLMQEQWQQLWDEATTGRPLYPYLPKVTENRFIGLPWVTTFITDHGPFPAYLHRFGKSRSPNCVCGNVGNASHYMFHCPLTSKWHLRQHRGEQRIWLTTVFKSRITLNKLKELYFWLMNNCDAVTATHITTTLT